MEDVDRDQRRLLVKQLDAVGWGLFFVWMGIAFLADVGWGIGLLGVGVIALGGQLARRYFSLPLDQFGLVIGIIFAVCGVWELLNIQLGQRSVPGGLVPILCIVVGTLILASVLRRKPQH